MRMSKKARKKTDKTIKEKQAEPAVRETPADPARMDELIKELRTKDELLNVRKTLLKKEEWGSLPF